MTHYYLPEQLPLQLLLSNKQVLPLSLLPTGQERQEAGSCATLQLAQLGSHTVNSIIGTFVQYYAIAHKVEV